MLGSTVFKFLCTDPDLNVTATTRTGSKSSVNFDFKHNRIEDLINTYTPDFIINCIGIIKPHIMEKDPKSIKNAIAGNVLLPMEIEEAVQNSNIKVIQIVTDCVYSGLRGKYLESDFHDATDVYGKTKSLGEIPSENFIHLRASIIGPEVGRSTSLLEWFLGQPKGSHVKGFLNHTWNGITTFQFAKFCSALIRGDETFQGSHHVLPLDIVTKFDLLRIFAEAYNRKDIKIEGVNGPSKIDRTLGTNHDDFNKMIWRLSGAQTPLTVRQMVFEQANLLL